MTKPYPLPAVMLQKKIAVKPRVFRILTDFPQTRGDKRILQYRYLQKHSQVKLSFPQFMLLRTMPNPETITRRAREIQNKKLYTFDNLYWFEEKPGGEEGIDYQWKWKYPHLRPTERTEQKIRELEEAERNYYGAETKITDYMEGK